MKFWIFKVIYMPIFIIISIGVIGILALMLKDVGWEQPFRWIVIIGTIAFIADKAVNP